MSKSKKNSLLWQITGDKLPGISYLFGTMHVRDERAFSLIAALQEKIDVCAAIATEINLDEAEHGILPTDMLLPGGKSLTDFYPPKKYAKIKRVLQKYFDFDLDPVRHFLPIMITNMLSEKILSDERDVNLDRYLWEYAARQEKVTLGVESTREQVEILHKIPMDYQLQSLRDVTKNVSSFRKQHTKLTEMYLRQDVRQLYKSTKKSLGKMRSLMLYDRNAIMAERINRMAHEQTIFAAVGAAHLAGKKGVVKRLQDLGLRVKPVRIPGIKKEV